MTEQNQKIKNCEWLAKLIKGKCSSGRTNFVTIDGRAGSGKTSLSTLLSKNLRGAPILKIDDFISWGDIKSFWPRLEREALVPLEKGAEAKFQARDWNTDPRGNSLREWTAIPPSKIVIFEGVGCSRKEMIGRIACSIWVETPEIECFNRGLMRDGESYRKLWEEWQVIETAFFTDDGTKDRADIIVSGEYGIDENKLSIIQIK